MKMAYEQLQQNAVECSLLKLNLQQVLQSEEELYQRLQQMHEHEKHNKKALEMASERLKNTQEEIGRTWKGSALIDPTSMVENEDKLQKSLKDACVTKHFLQVEAKRLLSEEKKLQQELRQMSVKEKEVFRLPLTQLKYRQAGECSLFFIY